MGSARIRDDRAIEFRFSSPPGRIVSLVPSDTYSLVALGALSSIVGRTRYCVWPAPLVGGIAIVGGTKDVDVERVASLAPDIVIANQEENTKQDITALEDRGIRVFVSFPKRVAQGIAHLARLAIMLGEGAPLVRDAYRAHSQADKARASEDRARVRVFIPIWMDPLMTVNRATFISDMLDLVGAENVFAERERLYPLAADLGRAAPLDPARVGDRDVRYPRVTLDEVVRADPALVLLPDEPHPFTESDAAVFRRLDMAAARAGQVVFCDGKDLMWYGARSIEGIARLKSLVDAAR